MTFKREIMKNEKTIQLKYFSYVKRYITTTKTVQQGKTESKRMTLTQMGGQYKDMNWTQSGEVHCKNKIAADLLRVEVT